MQTEPERNELPPMLVSSWQRCRKWGVDPKRVQDELLTDGELEDRRERMHDLFQACKPILETLYTQVRQSDFMVLVSDRDGYIVAKWGEPPFTERASRVRLDVGANWEERVKGTNAIGTALAESKPVTVWGNQHFCEENRFLTCYAAPLYSPTGELVGILDVSGDARLHHPHTLGMVITAAQACQARLLLQQTRRELVLHMREMDAVMESLGQPLIAVDTDGLITRLNQSAARLLGNPMADCIGQPMTRWFDSDDVQALLTKSDRDVTILSFADSDVSWVAKSVQDERKRTFRIHLAGRTPADRQSDGVKPVSNLVMDCPKVRKVFELAVRIAPSPLTLLIRGETGTGKDRLARAVHEASGRKGAFVAVNCGAIPATLVESELFGYEKGAFTGARKNGYKGKFEAADGGTLFLDEIGDMPTASQVALLRVLEEKKVTRIGSHRPIPVDVRVIAATHQNLEQAVAEGRFRADLFYRLREMELVLPALRERTDLRLLADHFLKQVEQELGRAIKVSAEVWPILEQYDWPGNLRELRQVIRQAAYQACLIRGVDWITPQDLPTLRREESGSEKTVSFFSIDDAEERAIAQAIQAAHGNLSAAARLLGIGRTTLYRKLHKFPHLKPRC
ncbi:sigma-54-dependent Fis family transcriptional regulator [Polycladomyces sp. WAk]|uniref:Sigma-54-dependent Fis family transcriptional regulator n=1 Tax=Polycladomyces zharkentensis TaxID=2807616 RepID=A0ABS2WLW2_9BACL|nr:sigma-54-dependent Fis family transcriptional regulator [Polycladomyces sp. WAk]MBN2910501.1 sigma-54-dependent Fis family transcriptional regulator [Polycladomyces sp. WAk]